MVSKALLTLLLSTQLIASGIAQQPQTPPPPMVQRPDGDDVVRISTNLVQVDAVITDDHGKLVTDLKPQEVEIFEDGHKQKVTNFSFALSPTVPAVRAARSAPTVKDAPPLPPTTLRREDIKR